MCKRPDSIVIDSRPSPNGWRRRRSCPGCGCRWSTYEVTKPQLVEIAEQMAAKQIRRKCLSIIRDAYEKVKEIKITEE